LWIKCAENYFLFGALITIWQRKTLGSQGKMEDLVREFEEEYGEDIGQSKEELLKKKYRENY